MCVARSQTVSETHCYWWISLFRDNKDHCRDTINVVLAMNMNLEWCNSRYLNAFQCVVKRCIAYLILYSDVGPSLSTALISG